MDKLVKSTFFKLQSGMLLSREIIENMNSQAQLFKVQYSCYPDGIIYGFEFMEYSNEIYITSGLIKKNGYYFFSESDICISELLDEFDKKNKMFNDTRYMSLAFVPVEDIIEAEGVVSMCMSLKLVPTADISEKDVIIAQMQYSVGKREWKSDGSAQERLKLQIKENGHNYSMLNTDYSLPYENTMSPFIFEIMKDCLVEKSSKSIVDMPLIFSILQNRVISLKNLKFWFDEYGKTVDMSDRKNIAEAFIECLSYSPVYDDYDSRTESDADNDKENTVRAFGL